MAMISKTALVKRSNCIGRSSSDAVDALSIVVVRDSSIVGFTE